ncbi:hypothetical protein ASE11_09575 [Hydrogenophaga sp. Root209]|uniref:DUF1579 family protein n=1 Tax=unclassified Hydrogenophaga TaxID=2610897 RepID=UPI0006F28D6C|nr:DUF1579 family protein [Hydrogenophaga sp. Root209]KRB99897.1 hypothetical protein ASE11_09575 [Hydrogenophaga sp. Root209]
MQRGSIRVLLGGRVRLHEYTGHCSGEPMEGVALIAHHLDERRYESAWAESFGTGTSIMFSTGISDDPRMDNINPTGEVALAVEVNYRRIPPAAGGT